MAPSIVVEVLATKVVVMGEKAQLLEKNALRASMVHFVKNALLALTKMLMGLMQIFAFLVLLTFCPIVQISYIHEEELISHFVRINAYLKNIGCQIALHLLRS